MKQGTRGGLLLIALVLIGPLMASAAEAKTGFLVVAPDRGFLGNQEVQTVFEDFKKGYQPASLALVGRDYNGAGSEYSVYLSRAIGELKKAGATDIVAVPLFLSQANPVLQKVALHLPAYVAKETLRWAPPMVESYLTAQVLLDRVDALSQDPGHERLILVGIGATDAGSEQALKADLEKLLAYVAARKRFQESQVAIYYDRDAKEATEKNKAVDALIIQTAAKKGRTLLIPAVIGHKFDHHMALTTWIGQKFKDLDVAYRGEELLPHPNVLLWLKKTANQYVAVSSRDIGVVIMPHGATQPYNDVVEQTIAPLKAKYKIEMAYGMGDPGIIQQAVSRLEQQGVRRIVFVRMYALEQHMKPLTDYILGLTETPADHGHDHDAVAPPQIRSAALFSTVGGYEEYPGIAEVLCERIKEVSKDPAKETVILLAHGSRSDEDNATWLSVMNANIERVRKDPRCAALKSIRAATVREDWPTQREQAVSEVRNMIQEGAKNGPVLVIANRLYGSGPYKKFLNGLEYVLNEKGLVHPVMTRWLEEGIGRTAAALTRVADNGNRVAQH